MADEDWIIDVHEKFEKARTLIDESKVQFNDSEPFKSHYAARDALKEIKTILESRCVNLLFMWIPNVYHIF